MKLQVYIKLNDGDSMEFTTTAHKLIIEQGEVCLLDEDESIAMSDIKELTIKPLGNQNGLLLP